ncbi:Acetamidase [Exophiala dermatitidis]|uniref:amidase n=1 Tax=Exophiala dermatitidis (strain ATCC 34100 / CBS 525.76 / NIH/UT8656) TaxID=858893 RepID=H6BJV5_EXODN|nr:amidase [Exophiala dermatitidis NIH/UT8656]EHY52325.1 amidase [Exophiala dermatitidis NIH/UT8656]
MVKVPWQEIAKQAQAQRDKSIDQIQPPIPAVPSPDELPLNVTSIPRELLNEAELKITESPPEELLKFLASGELSSVDVTTAFLRRAGIAQKLTNCVTEVLPHSAIQRAKYLDDYLAEHKKPIGPLHGLPISVKEHIGIKGLGHNGGFVGWWDRVAPEDAHILQLFQNAGCVLYVRTTQPQCLMHLETANNLYGTTVNPYNRNLTPGGSSGGEGALIALKGSPLGIGTDIGGSIRSPAANCGIWGFRPSSYRLPLGGLTAPMAGQEQIVPVIGPMSASFEGCHIFMKTLIDQQPWLDDPSLLPMPWNYTPNHSNSSTAKSYLTKPDGTKRLKIGVLWSDGVVQPHPPVSRALREVTTKLQSTSNNSGIEFEFVDWKPHRHDQAWDIISSMYFCDGAAQDRAAIASSGEPWLPLSEFIIKEQPGVKEYTVSEVWGLTIQREAYRAEYAKVWNQSKDLETWGDGNDATKAEQKPKLEYPVDVILCPVGPGAAPPLNHSRYWGYTAQWNLLDYPAMVFPVTQVDPAKDKVDESYKPLNAQDEWNYNLYSPDRYVDAPVSLQLVGRRYQDEKVFEAMEVIKKAVGGQLPLEPFR